MQHDNAAEQKIRAARARVAYLRPYFDSAIFSLVLVQAPQCKTLAVDQWKRLYYAPRFVHSLTVEELVPCLLHELGHVLRDHHRRAASMGVSHATAAIANIAQDAELNDDIQEEIISLRDMPNLPQWAIFPAKLKAPPDQVWEVYYQSILGNAAIEVVRDLSGDGEGEGGPESGETESGGKGGDRKGRDGEKGKGKGHTIVVKHDCGSGAHGVKREWEYGDPGNEGEQEGVQDADWEDVKQITAEKIAARHKERGDVPGHWASWADTLLRPRRVPWDQELSGGLRWAIADTSGMVFHSYKRPSRRSSALPNVIMPSMRKPKPFVCIVGDTSGSMSDHELALVRGVTEDICMSMGATVAFLATDAAVHGGVQKVGSGRKVELLGRGGTDMAAGIRYAMTHVKPAPDVIVVVTDCETPWPQSKPQKTRVIVCATGAPSETVIERVPKWARTILVDPDNTSSRI